MILNNTLILTLQDFRRQFDFAQFWVKRKQFVRDMSPKKIFYCNEEEKRFYQIISNWIASEENGDFAKRQNGLDALSALLKKKVSDKELSSVLVSIDCSKDIIYLPSGKTVNLQGNLVDRNFPPSNNERIHKFEVSGNDDAKILVGGVFACDLKVGDCVYITEIDGRFMRILPNHLEQGAVVMNLSNVPGEFGSLLEIVRYEMGKHIVVEKEVTQMTLNGAKVVFGKDKYLTIYK